MASTSLRPSSTALSASWIASLAECYAVVPARVGEQGQIMFRARDWRLDVSLAPSPKGPSALFPREGPKSVRTWREPRMVPRRARDPHRKLPGGHALAGSWNWASPDCRAFSFCVGRLPCPPVRAPSRTSTALSGCHHGTRLLRGART